MGPRSKLTALAIGAFINTIASTVAGAMSQSGSVSWPNTAVWLVGALWGVPSAWALVKAYLTEAT